MTILVIVALCVVIPSAQAAQNGSCWNDKVGWVNMSGVTFDSGSRAFGGTASYFDGTFDGTTYGLGQIDFGTQSNLSVTLAASAGNDGKFPLIGQAFSAQLGWFVANHGGTAPAALKPSGELTGNFWSNEFGWFNCSASDIGASNVQIWNPGSAMSSSSTAATQNADSDGSVQTGGSRGGFRPSVSTTPGTTPSTSTTVITTGPSTTFVSTGNILIDGTIKRLNQRIAKMLQANPKSVFARAIQRRIDELRARVKH